MYVKNRCDITITSSGKPIRFTALNAIEIDRSIDRIGTTVSLRIPTSARLVYSSAKKSESVQTARVFKRGDFISVKLGYDNRLNTEFEGFIYKIDLTTPLTIECMGYEYLLLGNIPPKTFKETTLKQLLEYVTDGITEISIDGDIPSVQMVNYVVPANLTRLDALQQLKERYGLTIYFIGSILYAGLDFIKYQGNVKYSLGINTPKADELKFQYAEDVKLKVKAIQINKNNTRIESEVGDKDGEQRTLFFYSAKSVSDLEKLALAEISKYKYTGYTGKITTFLEPNAVPGMVANITDVKYPERNGSYEVRSVVTRFSTAGARRTVEIGKSVTNG